MPLQLRKARPVSDVLNVTFQFIRENLSVLVRGLLYFAAPPIILGQIISVMATSPTTQATELGSTALAGTMVAGVLNLVGNLLATAVVLGAVYGYEQDPEEPLTLDFLRRAAQNNFGAVFGVYLLVMLYVIVLSMAGGFAAAVLIAPLAQSGGTVEIALIALLVLALVGGIFFVAVRLFLAFPARILEPNGANAAIKRSFRLVKGRFWSTLGVMLTAYLTSVLLSLVFSGPSLAIQVFVLAGGFAEASVTVQALSIGAGALAGAGSTVILAIPTLAAAVHYFNLVEQKEQTGLKQRVEGMAEEEDEEEDEEDEASDEPATPNVAAPDPGTDPGDGAEAETESDDSERWSGR